MPTHCLQARTGTEEFFSRCSSSSTPVLGLAGWGRASCRRLAGTVADLIKVPSTQSRMDLRANTRNDIALFDLKSTSRGKTKGQCTWPGASGGGGEQITNKGSPTPTLALGRVPPPSLPLPSSEASGRIGSRWDGMSQGDNSGPTGTLQVSAAGYLSLRAAFSGADYHRPTYL